MQSTGNSKRSKNILLKLTTSTRLRKKILELHFTFKRFVFYLGIFYITILLHKLNYKTEKIENRKQISQQTSRARTMYVYN